MGTRESYDEALAQRLALLRAELTGERAAAERVRARAREAPPEIDAADDRATAIRAPGRHVSRRFPAAGRLPSVLLAPGPIAVVAVILAIGLGLAAWLALRSQPEELPMAAPVAGGLASPVAVPGSSAGAAASSVSSPPTELVVHVAGKVNQPGIVVLPAGSRVDDAVRVAGGVKDGVDLAGVNLARPLVDGEQVLVGVEGAVAAPAGGAAATGVDAAGKVNLNTASAAQLEELPGVGPVTAKAIVAFRQEHGRFVSVDQLLDVSGIGEATLAEIAPHATV